MKNSDRSWRMLVVATAMLAVLAGTGRIVQKTAFPAVPVWQQEKAAVRYHHDAKGRWVPVPETVPGGRRIIP